MEYKKNEYGRKGRYLPRPEVERRKKTSMVADDANFHFPVGGGGGIYAISRKNDQLIWDYEK